MIGLLALGVGLLAVAALGVALTEVLLRRADIGAGLVLGVAVLNAVLLDQVPALAAPGGMRLQVYDVVFALLLGAGTLRLLRVRRFTGFQRCLVLLGLLLLLSLARGATTFGIERSVAESRLYLPFVSAALYFATFPPSNALLDRIGKLWLAMSVPMMVLVCLRWLAVFGGIDVGVPAAKFGADAAVKVIDGPYTFFLANAVVLTVPYWPLRGPRARRLTVLGAVLLLFVLLLNRRTVWLALLAGVAVVMLAQAPARAPCGHDGGDRRPGHGRRSMSPSRRPGREPSRSRSRLQAPAPSSGESRDGQCCTPDWSTDLVHWFVGQPFGSGFTRTSPRDRGAGRAAQLLLLDPAADGAARRALAHRTHLRAAARALAHPNPRRRPARARPVPGAADHAGHLVHYLGARPGAGNHHRSRGGPRGRRVRGGHLAFPHAGRWRTREASAGARPSRSPAGDGADPAGTSISAGRRR